MIQMSCSLTRIEYRLMFWLVSGASSRIEKSTMSGDSRSVFLSSVITQPTGLAFDRKKRRLCITTNSNLVSTFGWSFTTISLVVTCSGM